MSEIEKIEAYIKRSHVPENGRYCATVREAFAVAGLEPIEAFNLAFNYGKAKGYRDALAEQKKVTE